MGITDPATDEYVGDNPLKEVFSLNLLRRHLTESQRAGILTRNVLPLLKAQAKARQRKRTDLQELIPEGSRGQARDKAAELLGVNPHYISDAVRLQIAAPKLLEQVCSGA